jgi:hypothetical protein
MSLPIPTYCDPCPGKTYKIFCSLTSTGLTPGVFAET